MRNFHAVVFLLLCGNLFGQAPVPPEHGQVKDTIRHPDGSTEIVIQTDVSKADTQTVYSWVESSPEFPGGEDSLKMFLKRNVHYPSEAIAKDIQGVVYVNFVVNRDGSITDVKLLRGIHGGEMLNEEAIRAVKMSPPWKPGYMNGKPVRCEWNIPIKFILDRPSKKR